MCERSALIFSQPSSCANHIEDLDDWYMSTRKAIKDLKGDDNLRFLYASLAHSEYTAAVADDPINEELCW